MSRSDDIANLFRQFGGEPSDYREMGLDNSAVHARERWPLLAAIDVGAAEGPVASVRANQPTEQLSAGVPSRLFEGALQTRVHPPAAEPSATRFAPVQAPAPTIPAHSEAAGRVEPILHAPAPISEQPFTQTIAPSSIATRAARSVEPPISTHVPQGRPAAPHIVPPVTAVAGFENELVSVFRRLQSVPPQRAQTPQVQSSRESLLQRLLRS